MVPPDSGRTRASTVTLGLALALLSMPVGVCGAPFVDQGGATGPVDLPGVRSAEMGAAGVLAFSVSGGYYESKDIASFYVEDDQLIDAITSRYTSICLDASYGLLPWLGVCARLPFRRVEWDAMDAGSGDLTGLDAPRVGLKASLPVSTTFLSLGAAGRVSLPVGDELVVRAQNGPELHLSGGSDLDWEVMGLATLDLTRRFPLRLHANVGWAFNGDEKRGRRIFPDYYPAVAADGDPLDNDALILRGAVEFPGRVVDLYTEFRGDMIRDEDLVAAKENVLTISPGLRVRFGGGWTATASVSVGMSGDDSATQDFDPHNAYPDWAASASISYAWPVRSADSDGDGIPDYKDRCPLEPEDRDGFKDEDGCPDLDNDNDGVPDSFDGRPLQKEDYDGFEDDDGIPDLDNDGDGIIDERDMCPDRPEDLDGFEDEDGCPDE